MIWGQPCSPSEWNTRVRNDQLDLPLDEEMIGQLALEAEIRGMGIGELLRALILAIARKDLFQLIRDDSDPQTAKTSPI